MDQQQMELRQKLEAMISEFKRKALAYYVHFEAGERKLTQEQKNSLATKYGRETFTPSLDWRTVFGAELEESEMLDEVISQWLATENYDKEAFVIPRDRLKNKLWNETRTEGRKILDQLET